MPPSAHAELGGEIHNVSRNRALMQVLLQARKFGSCTFTEMAPLLPSGSSDSAPSASHPCTLLPRSRRQPRTSSGLRASRRCTTQQRCCFAAVRLRRRYNVLSGWATGPPRNGFVVFWMSSNISRTIYAMLNAKHDTHEKTDPRGPRSHITHTHTGNRRNTAVVVVAPLFR